MMSVTLVEKKGKAKHKAIKRKQIIKKIRASVKVISSKRIIHRINKTKNWFIENINKKSPKKSPVPVDSQLNFTGCWKNLH
jgi:hypothetical protein